MGLSGRDAFKVGFLSRCVEMGMTTDQIDQHVKQAGLGAVLGTLGKALGTVGTAGTKAVGGMTEGLAKSLAGTAAPLLLAAPPVIGGLGGWGLASATDVDDTDIDEMKTKEIKEELERQTAMLQRARLRQLASEHVKTKGRKIYL